MRKKLCHYRLSDKAVVSSVTEAEGSEVLRWRCAQLAQKPIFIWSAYGETDQPTFPNPRLRRISHHHHHHCLLSAREPPTVLSVQHGLVTAPVTLQTSLSGSLPPRENARNRGCTIELYGWHTTEIPVYTSVLHTPVLPLPTLVEHCLIADPTDPVGVSGQTKSPSILSDRLLGSQLLRSPAHIHVDLRGGVESVSFPRGWVRVDLALIADFACPLNRGVFSSW